MYFIKVISVNDVARIACNFLFFRLWLCRRILLRAANSDDYVVLGTHAYALIPYGAVIYRSMQLVTNGSRAYASVISNEEPG